MPKKRYLSDKYYNFAKQKLKPIYRSITGTGNLESLKLIKKKFPGLKIKFFKSGTKVFDWNVPHEWNIRNAYILDKNNNKIIDFKKNFLHVVGYSSKINRIVSKKNLLKLLIVNNKIPNAIPYVTAYYKKKFYSFCCSLMQKKDIEANYNKNDKFQIYIDSDFKKNGKMYYGEFVIKGKSSKEIFISTYICHPQMANNELSGPIVSMSLIEYFLQKSKKKLTKTIRFVFISETIGSIAYISRNLNALKKKVIAGYNLSCIGDEKSHSCMLSKNQNTISDRSLLATYKKFKIKPKIYSFMKRGSDERQYNFPGVNLPIASIFRSKYHEYKEYHTSLDDFSLVTPRGIRGGYKIARETINLILSSTYPKWKTVCEPNMGKRGLYPLISKTKRDKSLNNMMNFMTYADGQFTLEEIAKIIKIEKQKVRKLFNFFKINKLVSD